MYMGLIWLIASKILPCHLLLCLFMLFIWILHARLRIIAFSLLRQAVLLPMLVMLYCAITLHYSCTISLNVSTMYVLLLLLFLLLYYLENSLHLICGELYI